MRTWETNPFVKKPAPWRRLARRLRNWFRRGSRGPPVNLEDRPANVAKDDSALNVMPPFEGSDD